jgi:hypothetical protein
MYSYEDRIKAFLTMPGISLGGDAKIAPAADPSHVPGKAVWDWASRTPSVRTIRCP